LEYTQKCGGVKPINEIPTLPILIIGSPTVQNLIEKQTMIIKKQKTKKNNLAQCMFMPIWL
jgi:hypothetical protein